MGDGDPKVVKISSITGYPGSQGTFTYVEDLNEIIIAVWFGEVLGDPRVMHIPEFQDLAAFFEEAILESGSYTHPAGILHISARVAESFCIFINDLIWAEVNRRDLLDLIRRYAQTRTVVTNVPRPDDPVLKTSCGDVRYDDGKLIFAFEGHGLPEGRNQFTVQEPERFAADASRSVFRRFSIGSGLDLHEVQGQTVESWAYKFCHFGRWSEVQVEVQDLQIFAGQLKKLLAWEELYRKI